MLPQIKGNVIPGDFSNRINNPYLKLVAQELVETYCK